MITVPTLRFVGCTNIKQEVSMAQAEATLAKIYRDAETTAINDEVLEGLLNG
jgi:hypothetical protein